MDRDVKMARLSIVAHALCGLAAGYSSFTVHDYLLSALVGFGLLFAVGFSMERLAGKKGMKWWAMNGLIVYLFLWLVGWTYMLNVAV